MLLYHDPRSYKFLDDNVILVETCPELDTDYYGNSLNSGSLADEPITRTWEECGQMCKDEVSCNYWTWLGSQGGNAINLKCLLKSSNNGARTYGGAVSGAKDCRTLGII